MIVIELAPYRIDLRVDNGFDNTVSRPVLSTPMSSIPPQAPQPLAESPSAIALDLRGVLTDIDDTLTYEGQIAPEALTALAQLRAAGLVVIAITGRPAGWSEPFARDWPIDAIVAENGGVALAWRDGALVTRYAQDLITRTTNARRLKATAARLLREVPQARLARDSSGRITDIAIDHAEYHQLDAAAIDQVVAIMRAEGLNATVSSIHINGWIGDHDKWSGARWIVREHCGVALEDERARWVYVGDSANDQIMFQALPWSVGVANIAGYLPLLVHPPRYITRAARGAGFAELADHLLAQRALRSTL